MNRFGIYTAIVALGIASGFVACSNKAAPPPTGERDANGSVVIATPPAPAPAYDVPVRQLENGACPDVAGFFSNLRSLPDDAWIRRYTSDFKPGAKNEDGSTTRTNFLTVLTFSSFDVHERKMSEYRDQIDTVEQTGCQSVRMLDSDGSERKYLVRAASPTTIRLAQPERAPNPNEDPASIKDAVVVDIEWINGQEIRIKSSYSAMDFCPDYKTLQVTRTERLRWGPPSFLELNEVEQISAPFLNRAVKALAAVPEGLSARDIESHADTGGELSLKVNELRKLKNSLVRTDLKLCPFRAKPPSGDEPPPPEEDAIPTPTPTPDTGVERPASEGPTPPPDATPPSLN